MVYIIDSSDRVWPLILNHSDGFLFSVALDLVRENLKELVTSFMSEMQTDENRQVEPLTPRAVRDILDNRFPRILNTN